MEPLRTERTALTSEDDLARYDTRVTRLAWLVRVITVALAALAALAASYPILTQAREPVHYVLDVLFVALPVLFGIPMATYLRHLHIALLRRYQAQLVLRSAELQEMASRDELTQLYNRRHFYQRIQEELARARSTKQPLALVLLDVDGLKAINDEYGHMVGDTVIANLAKAIAKHTRASDVPARLGGDEFGVVMPDTGKRGAFALAQRLWEELEQAPLFEREGQRVMVNVSIGVSGFPWGGEDVDEMMHWADADMYANKLSRRLPAQAMASRDSAPEAPSLLDDLGF